MNSTIMVVSQADEATLEKLGVRAWPTWSKAISRFRWEYDTQEQCYLLEGEVTVTPEGGEQVTIRQGDLVTFPAGMRCEWDIHTPVFKHYRFD